MSAEKISYIYRAKGHCKYGSIVPINATDIYVLIYLIRGQMEAR
jgi:hypothetical protein